MSKTIETLNVNNLTTQGVVVAYGTRFDESFQQILPTIVLSEDNAGWTINANDPNAYIMSFGTFSPYVGGTWRVGFNSTVPLTIFNNSGNDIVVFGVQSNTTGNIYTPPTTYPDGAQMVLMEPDTPGDTKGFYDIAEVHHIGPEFYIQYTLISAL